MFTLTNFPHDPQEALIAFTNTVRDIRDRYRFEYLRFNEVGKRTGMRHAHLLCHGDYVPVRFFGYRAKANGLGSVDGAGVKGQVAGVELYITKYITKDPRTWSGRKLGYSKKFFDKPTSQLWSEFREETFNDQEAILMLKEEAQLILQEPGADLPANLRFKRNQLLEKFRQDKKRTPWLILPVGTARCPKTDSLMFFVVCERCDYFGGVESRKGRELEVRCTYAPVTLTMKVLANVGTSYLKAATTQGGNLPGATFLSAYLLPHD